MTQPERTEASRNALIGATLKVIADEGYGAASLIRISEVAGVSRGLANYHFGTKRKLIEAVIKQITGAYHATLPSVDDGAPGYDCIEMLFTSYLDGLAAGGASTRQPV
ncbi:TetR/AcrR family transcriptional regulator [Blastococcus brunescens]|uniref:TetR family transcriptional regulator n=1 Tax=Blastococcus brunescens TaxID=1564165 RepID=A0ABZ1B6U2_9ACTN|nr:TetR family transcriptional regulator [Blastococcus sp. BMG 8361]WRL65416.1 TetR family transcriptional regulator [Blastococcus sp. BMG 8361]